MVEKKIKLTCPCCGSDKVLADAYASWDIENQVWKLYSVYDDKRCNHCGAHFKTANEETVES